MLLGYNSDELDSAPGQRYAVVILLPKHLNEIIAPVRRRFDPDYTVIDSHVTVVFPFRSEKQIDDIASVIRRTTQTIAPFQVELSSIGDFYPSFPLIFWAVNRDNALGELYKNLYAAIDLALPHKHFVPHVTVAREISPHRVVLVKEEIVSYLPDEKFTATTVDLVSPVDGRKWVSIQSFPLEKSNR